MDAYTHTAVAAITVYFAWKIGRTMQKNSLIEQVASDTLNRLEKGGLVKYIIKNGEKVYRSHEGMERKV